MKTTVVESGSFAEYTFSSSITVMLLSVEKNQSFVLESYVLIPLKSASLFLIVKSIFCSVYFDNSSKTLDEKVFETLVLSLENRRIRQTYGNLLNFDEENFDVGDYQELELKIKEDPEQLIVQDITDLYTVYKEYIKISRFQPDIDIAEASEKLN